MLGVHHSDLPEDLDRRRRRRELHLFFGVFAVVLALCAAHNYWAAGAYGPWKMAALLPGPLAILVMFHVYWTLWLPTLPDKPAQRCQVKFTVYIVVIVATLVVSCSFVFSPSMLQHHFAMYDQLSTVRQVSRMTELDVIFRMSAGGHLISFKDFHTSPHPPRDVLFEFTLPRDPSIRICIAPLRDSKRVAIGSMGAPPSIFLSKVLTHEYQTCVRDFTQYQDLLLQAGHEDDLKFSSSGLLLRMPRPWQSDPLATAEDYRMAFRESKWRGADDHIIFTEMIDEAELQTERASSYSRGLRMGLLLYGIVLPLVGLGPTGFLVYVLLFRRYCNVKKND
jgi:hypothetical protein